mmetsp:Transcript_2678/g.4198  ORF Transcript_2678/g.4198 Transcript_2678/m.4198 type:complete len:104 (-) Transcript_2678:1306-1617(-)
MQNEVDINKVLNLDNHTMCIPTFPDPFITCCFISDEKVYVNLFHNATLTHYHFIFDVEAQKLVGKVVSNEMECTRKNFPYRCFFSHDYQQIYSFYRQGQTYTV